MTLHFYAGYTAWGITLYSERVHGLNHYLPSLIPRLRPSG